MDSFKSDLREYGSAVMKHSYALILGAVSLLIMLVQLLADATGMKLWPWWASLIVFAFAVHWAQMLAWRDMKRERDALRKYNIAQNSLDRIAEYREKLVLMQNEHIRNETELGAWIERKGTFRKEIVQYLEANISPAESKLFKTLGLFTLYYVANPPPLNDEHTRQRSMIARDYFWLDRCARDYGSRKLRPEEDEPDQSQAGAATVSL